VTLGEIVNSKAGRDADRFFIIVKIIDETYVLISDGDLRKIEKPKRKKLKHLTLTGVAIDSLNEKLVNKLKVTNAEIRKMMSLYVSGNTVKGEESNNIDN
jgi:ribosomal protein L14E/L6E/L27E